MPSSGCSGRTRPCGSRRTTARPPGPSRPRCTLDLRSKRGLDYLLTAPGTLGMARAYLQGRPRHRADRRGRPLRRAEVHRGPPRPEQAHAPRSCPSWPRFLQHHRPHAPRAAPEETPGQLRRMARGCTHGRARDAEAIHHHYDVSNRFYEMLLGPSMAYTCAVYPTDDATLEEAQDEKFDLVCRKLGLRAGDAAARRRLRLGRHGASRRHCTTASRRSASTLSEEQASWAQRADGARGARRSGEIRLRRLPRRGREPASTRCRRSASPSTSG